MSRPRNLLLRAAEIDDGAALARLYSEPSAVAGTLQLPYPSAGAWTRKLEEASAFELHLLACVRQDVAGHGFIRRFAEFARRQHAATLGLAVRSDWQRRGIGDALMQALIERAEQWMQIRRIELEVYVDNHAAIALYRKHGFVEEGLLRNYAFRDGQWVDVVPMARLR